MMGQSGQPGPLAIFGQKSPASQINSDLAPSVVAGGWGLIDQRLGFNNTRKGLIGMGSEYFRTGAYVPSTAATANIAALANVVNNVPMTLVNATGAGITVLAAAKTIWPSGTVMPAGTLVIDAAQTFVNYGLADSNGNYRTVFYDNASIVGRGLSLTGVGAGAGGNILVSGYDVFGYPLTQLVTVGAGANTVNTLKAFKYIPVGGIVPKFTDAHNYSIGTADVFGFPLQSNFFHDLFVWWNSALITANTGYLAAVATSPSTNLLGDVRGTYAVQSASDGVKRLVFAQSLSLGGAVVLNGAVSNFGVLQV